MSTRIKGKSLSFQLGETEYMADASNIVLSNEEADGDVTTFADAAAGGTVQWFFEMEAIQSTDPDSLWRFLWDSTGDEVTYIFAPHGNTAASAEQPHFTGSVKVGPKPAVGGTANETFTFEVRLDCTDEPTLVTA